MRGIVAAGQADASAGRRLDALTAAAKDAGAGGLIWAKRTEAGWEGQGVKAIGAATLDAHRRHAGRPAARRRRRGRASPPRRLHAVRAALTRRPGVTPSEPHAFCWVVDFPLFEQDPATGAARRRRTIRSPRRTPTTPRASDSEPWKCRALHYDAVYNGNELGSGSIRITDPGAADDDLRAARHPGAGASAAGSGSCSTAWPPARRRTAGSRSASTGSSMLLAGATSLRDVIAFPKTTAARALFEGAPTTVDAKDLAALHLEVTGEG